MHINTSINPIGIDKMFGLTNISQLNPRTISTINDETSSPLILHSLYSTSDYRLVISTLFCILQPLLPLALFALLVFEVTC